MAGIVRTIRTMLIGSQYTPCSTCAVRQWKASQRLLRRRELEAEVAYLRKIVHVQTALLHFNEDPIGRHRPQNYAVRGLAAIP